MGAPKIVSDASFADDVLMSDKPVVVDFKAVVLRGDLLEDGSDHLARTAPLSPVVHEDGFRGTENLGFEGLVVDVDNVVAQGILPVGQCFLRKATLCAPIVAIW